MNDYSKKGIAHIIRRDIEILDLKRHALKEFLSETSARYPVSDKETRDFEFHDNFLSAITDWLDELYDGLYANFRSPYGLPISHRDDKNLSPKKDIDLKELYEILDKTSVQYDEDIKGELDGLLFPIRMKEHFEWLADDMVETVNKVVRTLARRLDV